MKTTKLFFLFLTALFLSANVFAQPAGENPANWTPVNSLSDEFNGNTLNTGKWNFGHPFWVGRSPSLFGGAANAFVNNGLLVMKVTWVGGATNYMRSGSIWSKNRDMTVGMYSEVQFRSHSLKMGNGFWFVNNTLDNNNRADEIDVQEAFPTVFPTKMKSNVHNPQPNFTNDQPQPQTFTIANNGTVDGQYHRYGVWIVNNRTLRFYLDGVFQKQVITNSTIQPLWLLMNQETYDFIPPPNQAQVNNGAINSTYINYIRTWQKTGGSSGGNGSRVTLRGPQGLVSSENATRTMTANRPNAGAWEKFFMTTVGTVNGNDLVTLQGSSGFVSSENGSAAGMNANRTNPGAWERFELISYGNNVYSLKGNNGKFVSTNGGGNNPMVCNRNVSGAWEKFNITFGVAQRSSDEQPTKLSKSSKALKLKVFYPTSEKNKVSISGVNSVDNMDVFDVSGRSVSFSVEQNSKSSINITFPESLASGVYIVKTDSGAVRVMKR